MAPSQPFSLSTISLPPRPGTGARSAAGTGAGTGTGGMGAVGSSALMAGFMASMAMAPGGQQMLTTARGSDGSAPFSHLSGFGAEELFKSFQARAEPCFTASKRQFTSICLGGDGYLVFS